MDELELELDELPEATDPDPGVAPTVPLTVMTVAATGEVSVQLFRFGLGGGHRGLSGVHRDLLLAGACLGLGQAVWAWLTCCWSFSFVLASEFVACVTEF